MAEVLLHVGLAKTGTTTVQRALQRRRRALARHGLLFPGERHHDQRLAAYDLLGRRIQGERADRVAGSWERLAAEIDATDLPRVVVSEELLALARPRQVRHLVRRLSDHEVSVVVGVRDLGRTVVSAWQQEVAMGQTYTWEEFAAAVREPEEGSVRAGVAFWLRHDALRVLDSWESAVPRSRVHLVTVPPPAAPAGTLLARFAGVLGVPPEVLDDGQAPRNASLGPAELEVVRRLNVAVRDDLTQRQHLQVVDRMLRPGLAGGSDRPLRLPAEDLPWVRARSEVLAAQLAERGHPVHGDLADLLPAPAGEGRRLDDVTEAELAAAQERALVVLARGQANRFERAHRAAGGQAGGDRPRGSAASGLRAWLFRRKERALEAADRHRSLAWLARRYLRHTSGVR